MSGSVYELAILLSLKDSASGGLDRAEAKLRSLGKEGKQTLKTFQDLRADLKKDLAIGGIGVSILAGMGKGIKVAGDFEASLLDLKSAYQEAASAGGMSTAEQANQLNQLESLAVRLGNNLQGTTGDYVGILASLRKAGVDAKTVLGGAGEAASNLANVSGALLQGRGNEQAKELGQFGKMFKLQPDDFIKSVNLFSAAKDRFDVDSSSLIESAKYFQATAGSMKITGFEGAGETIKMFALLKRQGGMEGSMAGTGLRSFFTQITSEKKKIASLKKDEGIDLSQMFDAKGEFRGFENALRIMGQFRKLSPQKRTEKLNNIFGERGGEVAGAMVDAGVDGWKSINAEMAKAVPVSQKINAQMDTYNAKMEALYGTLTNITAVSFTPMLNTVKPMIDVANSTAGWIQSFAQANPEIAGVVSHLVGLAGVALTVRGGIGAMTTAWKLWRIVSAVGSSDTAIIASLRGQAAAASSTAASMKNAGAQATGLRGKLNSLAALSTIRLTVQFMVAGAAIEQILKWKAEYDEQQKNLEEKNAVAGQAYDDAVRGGRIYRGTKGKAEDYASLAHTSVDTFKMGKTLEQSLMPERRGLFETFWTYQRPYGAGFFELGSLYFKPETAGRTFRQSESGKALFDPQVLAVLIREARQGKIGDIKTTPEGSQQFLKSLEFGFPEVYKQASAIADEFLKLGQPTEAATKNFTDMLQPTSKLPSLFGQVGDAATRLSNRLDSIQPTITFGTDGFFGNDKGGRPAPKPQGSTPFKPPSTQPQKFPSILDNVFKSHASIREPRAPTEQTASLRLPLQPYTPQQPQLDSSRPFALASLRAEPTEQRENVRRDLRIEPLAGMNERPSANLLRSTVGGGGRGVQVTISNITVPAGSKAADDPREFAERVASIVEDKIRAKFGDMLYDNKDEFHELMYRLIESDKTRSSA